jgi:hypothetical protein
MAFQIPVTLTAYFPINSGVEGGPNDCKGRPLITLQQHLADPQTYPYASVAGDCTIWPDGQRIILPDVNPDAVFRIVDTGGHFHGLPCDAGCTQSHCKCFRNPGYEPFDVCLDPGSGSIFSTSTATIVDGDDFGTTLCGGPTCISTWDGQIHLPDYLAAEALGVAAATGQGPAAFLASAAGAGLIFVGLAFAMRSIG